MSTPPWRLPRDLPWHVLTSPVDKWAEQPSFVIGEYLFIACAAAALVHALLQGPERRKHLLGWLGALLAGTANDVLFMALPLVDNFWQAQATIMLTPRLPLYIPCVYICFMYYPLVSVWRLNLPPLARAALTGLGGMIFYAPYDIVGAKFLWWTWHDSDLPIANRLLGAPLGSTMWTLTFTATFAFLLNRVIDKDPQNPAISRGTFLKGLLTVAAFSSLLMVVQVTGLQQLDGGVPGLRGLLVAVVLYSAIVAIGWRHAAPAPRRASDRPLRVAVVGYFATLVLVMALFDPQTHRSASMHQTYGPCRVEATDITGHTRFKYLCAQDFDEDFTFACVDKLPRDGSEWYTVCGRPHQSFPRFAFGVSAYCLLGLLLFLFLLGALRPRPATART